MAEWTADRMRENYDWREAWGYGGDIETCAVTFQGAGPHGNVSACAGSKCSSEPVTVDMISRVIAASDGEHDERDWVAVAELKDGRFAYVESGCDYTGWDCQADGRVWVSHSLENLWFFGLTQQGRERLGQTPPMG